MDYHKEFIIDFARRTRANLEFIESASEQGANVFEVTQLANSLLGLLVFPREHYMRRIPDTPLGQLVEQGWPDIKTTHGRLKQDTLKQLMRMLRNGITHCNVEFLAGPDMQITGLTIWNSVEDRNTGHNRRTWQAELTIADLRDIAFQFIELIEADVRNEER